VEHNSSRAGIVADFERVREQPNLLDIYGDTEVTIYGMTGTLSELGDLCTADESTRTEEANNRFVVAAMNEAGAEILPEHASYFRSELERRGLESKVVVREEQPLDQPDASEKKEVFTDVPESTIKAREDLPSIVPVDRIKITNDIHNDLHEQASVSPAGHESVPMVHAATEIPLEVREQLLSLFDEPIGEGLNSLPPHEPISREDIPIGEPLSAGVPKYEALAGSPGGITVHEHDETNATPTVRKSQIVNLEETTETQRVISPIIASHSGESVMHVREEEPRIRSYELRDTAEKRTETASDVVEGSQVVEMHTGFRAGPEILSEELATDEVCPTGLPDTFIALLQSLQVEEKSVEHEIATTTEEKKKIDATEFVEVFIEHIHSLPENPLLEPEDQPAVVMESIIETAALIQQLQKIETDPQQIKAAKEELMVLCKRLFENLGTEADEKMIAAFIEKVLASDLSQITQKELTPQELAKLGTREYKLEDWFHKFKQLLDDTLHPHQTIGRLALRLNMGLVT